MNKMASATALIDQEIEEFVREAELQDLNSLYKIFRGIEVQRVARQTRQTHLKKQVVCPECFQRFGPQRSIWIPNKTVKSCPHCTVCSRNAAISAKLDDEDKAKGKKRTVPDKCPHCGSKICKEETYIPAPKTDLWVEMFLPKLRILEEELRVLLEEKVSEHPLWEAWAKDVKGLGKVTLGRIMGMCNLKLLPTVTKMWAHAGLGLKDGKPQRRQKGKLLDYNDELRSAFYLLGQSLTRQQGAYYDFYKIRRERAEKCGLTKLHAHNRARFEMLKLVASHIWRMWREVEGLETPAPYAIELLEHRHYIPPQNCLGEDFGGYVTLPDIVR